MKLSTLEIHDLLTPYLLESAPEALCEKIARYLDLLKHWNSRINLTAVREPEQVVQRHFGEGLFLARYLPSFQSLLDFGSGAGFPGLPIAIAYPRAQIVLAESHMKKAAFLREAAWMVGSSVTVWANRVEQMPETRTFDVVTLRAVDCMQEAMEAAAPRIRAGGVLAFFVGKQESFQLPAALWLKVDSFPVPNNFGKIVLAQRD